ncbi:MAG: YbaN family protein [Rhizobiaceae bacterium]
MNGITKGLYFVAGVISLLLGIIGIALPLLPTTPFVLLSIFCFGKSSKRWHDWLLAHPRFGPMISAWREHGAISNRAKRLALIAMAAGLLLSFVLGIRPIIIALQAIILSAVALFLLTRPAPPETEK